MDFDIGTMLIWGGFGLIIGSFLNVLILRSGSGANVGGRSRCMVCGKQLRWHHLIPLFSYIALRGRCAYCGTRISLQYPVVELTLGIAFALLGSLGLPLVEQVLAYVFTSLLLAIAVYDIRHTIIPNSWAYLFAGTAILYSLAVYVPQVPVEWFVLALSGPLIALPLFAMWFVSGGTWMGLGDAKLGLGIGWLLGPYFGLVALFLAFIIGALFSLGVLMVVPRMVAFVRSRHPQGVPSSAARGGFTMKSEVPFGPFLACSCFLVFILHSAGYLVPLALF